MSSEPDEKQQHALAEYQAGQSAFERGQYRQAVEHLAKASALISQGSQLSGEMQMWLVTAYEAAGQRQEAIALCQQLRHHPDLTTRQQSRRLLYILEAPKLSTKPEWLVEIPDLAGVVDRDPQPRQGSARPAPPKSAQPTSIPEPVDLSQVNTRDNQFIWVMLGLLVVALGGLVWFS